jgi:hypothetical protein
VKALVAAILVAAIFASAAYAQIAGTNGGTSGNHIGPSFDRKFEDFGMGLGGGVGTTGAGPTACLAGQLDFSLATGCNVAFYVLGVT